MTAIIDEALRAKIMPLKMMIFDVDGVLTDGGVIYQDDGSEIKIFDVKDGHGIKLLQRAGIEVALISGRFSKTVEHRAVGLGIARVYQGAKNKIEFYDKIRDETGLTGRQMGYMGDDLIDVPVMRRVGFSVAVADASPHVLPHAHYITRKNGGHGAAREICELILQVQGLWEDVVRRYFEGPLGP
jgi:3-deoxy-D-manno-octulosonate 8-phosphate phosphatase (KDO 8-P phosphatase)